MTTKTVASEVLNCSLSEGIATLTMYRPDKRNAMNDTLLAALDAFFSAPPEGTRVVILQGTHGHYCSGLDLSEQVSRAAETVMHHSRHWHGVMDKIQYGGLPVVSLLEGAVMGGGLELACATHVRVALPSTRFQLPEGRRGIFVGGGATVRVGRILGADRMIEMMLTGRIYNAEEGRALGLCHYAASAEDGADLARALAVKIAQNAPMPNYLMINAISRIDDMSRSDGLFAESLAAALSQTTPDAEEGLNAFLQKRPPVFR